MKETNLGFLKNTIILFFWVSVYCLYSIFNKHIFNKINHSKIYGFIKNTTDNNGAEKISKNIVLHAYTQAIEETSAEVVNSITQTTAGSYSDASGCVSFVF